MTTTQDFAPYLGQAMMARLGEFVHMKTSRSC
jgi:hypothetical protein